jgi:hypothetical protein
MLVSVVGEPGIGKTRTVRELARYIDSLTDIIVTWRRAGASCAERGVVLGVVRDRPAHTGILDSDSPDEVWRRLSASALAASDASMGSIEAPGSRSCRRSGSSSFRFWELLPAAVRNVMSAWPGGWATGATHDEAQGDRQRRQHRSR